MSQEQKDHVEPQNQQVVSEESDSNVAALATTPTPNSAPLELDQPEEGVATDAQLQVSDAGKKRGRARKRGRLVNAEDVMPRPSLWPIGLAFSLMFVLFGVLTGPVFIGIGVLLLVGCGVGWALERR